jgi:hypothetical protein
MGLELTWEQRDLIARRDLLRANAKGARHMAERFDEAADAINAELNEDRA